MSTGPKGAPLYAVRAADPLTAADAVAWFAPGAPPGGQVIGYTLSARAATWLRVGATGAAEAVGRAADDVLAEAYEMVLFDGERELRWLRALGGRGPAIAVGENRSGLPTGQDVTADPPPRRDASHPSHTRLLAGVPRPHDGAAGWTTLRSERYATVHLPLRPVTDAEALVVETVEYLVEDEHGNLDVGDTRTLGLRATTLAAVREVTAAPRTGRERTAA